MEIITGRQGSGKTTLMYKKIAALKKGERVFVVVPEQYTYIAERQLFDRLGVDATSEISVISLNRLAHKLTGTGSESLMNVLTDESRNIIIRYIISQNAEKLRAFGSVCDRSGFAENVGVIFGEIIKNGITPQKLQEAGEKSSDDLLRAKLEDMKLLYESYISKLGDEFADKDTFLVKCSEFVRGSKLVEGAHFFFDDFVSFDKSDYEFISAIMETAASCCFCLTHAPGDFFEVSDYTLKELKSCAAKAGKSTEVINMGEKKSGSEAIKFIEKNAENFAPPNFEGVNESVCFNTYSDIYEEVRSTAALIVKLCRKNGYRMKDISVSVSDVNAYGTVINDVFPAYGIPFFIDSRRKIAHSSHVRSLIFIIGSQARFDENDVIAFAKTGFSEVSYDDCCIFENYIVQFGIRRKMLFKEFVLNDETAPYDLEKLNCIRKKILAPLEKYADSVKNVSTVGEYAKALYSYLEEIGFNDGIKSTVEQMREVGDFENANIYAQIFNKIISVIQSLYVFFENEPYNASLVYQMISYALLNCDVGVIPAVEDSLSVGDTLRSRSSDVKCSFVLGAVEGKLPTTHISAAILTDREKMEAAELGLELVSTSAYRISKENLVIYTLVSKPSERLYMSCPAEDGSENSAGPCEMFLRFQNVFPSSEAQLSLEDYMCTAQSAYNMLSVNLGERKFKASRDFSNDEIYDAYFDYMQSTPELAPLAAMVKKGLEFNNKAAICDKSFYKKYLGAPLNTSVSRLEKYAQCPFAFFAGYVLKLTKRKVHKVETYERGNIIHRVIEIFSKRILRSEYDISSMQDDEVRKAAKEICEVCMSTEYQNLYSGFVNSPHMTEKLKNLSAEVLSEIVRQMKLSDFFLEESEAVFGKGQEFSPICVDTPEGRVYLRGKIDRVDACEINSKKYIKIIDYKTGSVTLDLEKIYFGLSMQLPVYIRALTSEEKNEAAGIFYLDAHDPLAKVESEEDLENIKKRVSDNFKLNGIVLKDLEVLKALDNNYENESFISGVQSKSSGVILKENVMEKELFSAVIDKAIENVKTAAEKMLSGEISAYPSRKVGYYTACTYCDYKSVCKFSSEFEANEYRTVGNIKNIKEKFMPKEMQAHE